MICFREPFGRQTAFNSPTDRRTAVVCFRFAFRGHRRSTRRTAIRRQSVVVCCSGIERLAAINRATDFRAGLCVCVLASRSKADRRSIRRTAIRRHCVVVRCSGVERLAASTARQTFEPECVIVFCYRDQRPSDINSPDDDRRTLCFVPNASRTNHSQASASETNRREAVAGHGIERGQNVERAVDLRFICGSVLMPPNDRGKPAAAKTVGRQKTRDPPLGLTDLLGDAVNCGSLTFRMPDSFQFAD